MTRPREGRFGRVRARSLRAMRIGGPIVFILATAAVLVVIAVQVGEIVAKNVDVQSRVSAAQSDIVALRAKRAEQLQAIRRLSDPRGAIPEIHDKLRMVGPHEELIYLSGADAPSPGPLRWRASP